MFKRVQYEYRIKEKFRRELDIPETSRRMARRHARMHA